MLDEIEKAHGPILVGDLGRKLDIDPGVLEGMIEFWIRKGRLCDDDAILENGLACAPNGCSDHCAGSGGCAFTVKLPKTYSIKKIEMN
ncbi:MAG: FeoC-like transcriptional regulator [Candidatus Promineifilaceae bacterium]|nr:FeoC-like transcriptional regulator [Candidatus Promineifilaceae bacterium]